MIKVIYNKTCGRCVQSEPLTSGMVGQTIHFEYSHDFDGLAVTAVFTDGKNTVDVVNPGNECVIPHEVLTTVGAMVKVGIYATRGNELVIPTIYAHIGVVLKGADPSGDVSIDPTLPVWAQVQEAIGNLNDLTTEAKNNLVAAINEAAQSGGGGSASIAMRVDGGYIQYSTDNGKTWVNLIAEADLKGDPGAPGVAGAPGKDGAGMDITGATVGQIAKITAVDDTGKPTAWSPVDMPTGGGDISTTAKNLLITILRSGVYTDDQSNNITALETALGGGTTEPDTKTYAISNELINCTTSNSATSVKENAAYSATLTANDGYTLTGGTVTITMGGVDITSTAYADGVITIAAVTGDVEIFASAVVVQAEAALPEDGLVGYFDFRTTTYDNASSGGKTTIAPTKGSGQLYAWANNSISVQNEYGLKPANTRAWLYDQNGGTTETALGNAFTVIQLTYGEAPSFGFNYTNLPPRWTFNPKYINTSGSTVEAEKINGSNFNSDSSADYNFTVFRADGATLTEIFDTSRTTYNGGGIDGFSRWLDMPYGNIVDIGDTKYCTAMAIYNRALTDSEIEAAREFMKTLEVTA